LILTGSLPEKSIRQISDVMQKQYTAAYKALKFDDKDKLIRGKVVVYCFGTKREFGSFSRQVRQERPEPSETFGFDFTLDDCFLAVVAEQTGNLAIDPDVSASIAMALIERKVGGKFLPPWVSIGFRKAIVNRTDLKTGEANRKTLRGLLMKGTAPATIGEMLADDVEDKILYASSVMEYLAFAPSPKLIDFITAFRPSEDVPQPTLERAKMLAGFKEMDFEKGWRNWVLKGK
jgi:hypothetical protein